MQIVGPLRNPMQKPICMCKAIFVMVFEGGGGRVRHHSKSIINYIFNFHVIDRVNMGIQDILYNILFKHLGV